MMLSFGVEISQKVLRERGLDIDRPWVTKLPQKNNQLSLAKPLTLKGFLMGVA